ARLLHAADEELFHSHSAGNFLEWFFGVADGEWNQDSSRPRRNLVNVEPEPIWKQDDFGRDRGNSIIIVLPEEAEIDLGKCIDFGASAEFENFLSGADQCRMIGGIAGEFEAEIGFYRGADV